MKKILLILVAIIIIYNLNAQKDWPPIGAKWYYSYIPCSIWGCNMNLNEYIYFEATKDTIINDISCKKIIVEYHNKDGESKYLGNEYFYSTENKVYNFHNDHFYLLYDFSLEVGDTIELKIGSNSNLYTKLGGSDIHFDTTWSKHIITKKGTISINGIDHQYINIELIEDPLNLYEKLIFNNQKIIKGIGSLLFIMGNIWSSVEVDLYGPLRCYSDPNINYTTDFPCDTIISTIYTTSINNTVKVYPNPIIQNSVISFPLYKNINVKVDIFNIAGKKIEQGYTLNGEYKLNAEQYTSGIYFYKIYSNNSYLGSGSFVKTID